MTSPETNGRKIFLEARLAIAQKEWEKAHKKWIAANKRYQIMPNAPEAKILNAQTRMANLHGQRMLLKELISLEKS
jgi:hypothetical protein